MTRPDPTASSSVPPPPPVAVVAPPARDADLVLAGLHLRLGSLALARAELETLAVTGRLDGAGRVDLAEVRWRTGELVGAGDAAREALAGGDESAVALVVAAEAAAALGRPSEARRLAGQAMARTDGPIDPIFAGMPRSGAWPADPAEPAPSPATLFPPDRGMGGPGPTTAASRPPRPPSRRAPDAPGQPPASTEAAAAVAAALAAASVATDPEPGFWDIPPVDSSAADARERTPDGSQPIGLEPAAILDAGEAALAAGDYATAALYLGLAVRVAPQIAPAILDAIGETPDTGLQMVRGDAYRAVGRETDARRAYEAAMATSGTAPDAGEPDPDPPTSGPGVGPRPMDGPATPDDDSDPFAGEP